MILSPPLEKTHCLPDSPREGLSGLSPGLIGRWRVRGGTGAGCRVPEMFRLSLELGSTIRNTEATRHTRGSGEDLGPG